MDLDNSVPATPIPPPQVPEHPYTDIPGLPPKHPLKKIKRLSPLLPLLLLLGFLPIATGAVLYKQYISGNAANASWLCRQKISVVRINPGKIETAVGNPPTQMSALAYDSEGRPVWKDVSFEWGMSSSNTVGNIVPKGQLATFKPLNVGTGNVFITATYCGQKATGSAHIIVSPAVPTPTPKNSCTPRPSCLDSKPACKIAIPVRGWCPRVTPTPVPPKPTSKPTITPAPTVTPVAGKRVFITSLTYNGNLGGLSGADLKCQQRAATASLSGTWKAWLSDNTTSAASRLSHSNLPYVLLNGTKIANNWADLVDGTLASNILIDENGSMHGNYVWTGTDEFGAINGPTVSKCSNWTALSNDSPTGPAGHSGYTNYQWTRYNLMDNCANLYALYCFEQ